MTFNGWLQIAIYAVLVILITKPFGGYMTRVFNGERTLLRPVLRPIERRHLHAVRRSRGRGAALARLRRRDAGVQLRRLRDHVRDPAAAERAAVQSAGAETRCRRTLAFNTSVSFMTNTNWQSYVPETTMSYLTQMCGADGAQLRLRRHRHRARHRADPRLRPAFGTHARQLLGRSDPLRAVHPAAHLDRRRAGVHRPGHAGEPERLYRCGDAGRRQAGHRAGSGGFAGSHQDDGHQRRRLLQCELVASVRESQAR